MTAELYPKFLRAVRYLACERWESARRQSMQRVAYIEAALRVWNEKRYPTWGQFLQSPKGRKFQRRRALARQL